MSTSADLFQLQPPPLSRFRQAERSLILSLDTPLKVQRWLRALPYNWEKSGETQRSFRQVARLKTAHCLEAALAAAVVLEQHGYPPILLSFESVDRLDHVIFAYRRNGLWGSVARSRDEGLHGRRPLFRSARNLALSYFDPYVDLSGRITGYAVINLNRLGSYDWRLSERNLWKVEQYLIDYPHRRIVSSELRYQRLLKRYQAFRARYPDRKVVYYKNRWQWS
jgi:phosphatidylserine/phosphatidylglycerophosphate/cardiolipin synthase-like enzyme